MLDMDLLTEFERTLHTWGVLRRGDKVVVGVSGGPDSLALLHLFMRASASLGIHPHAIHVNHRIRGEDADADARFVAEIAAGWDIPCHVVQMDVPALAAERRLSLEEAARQARYTALAQQATALGARLIAVGHNADDQAETVLMHLLRGAGLAGLRGMLPVTNLGEYHLLEPLEATLLLIRPLLNVPRAAIEAYCAEWGLTPHFDRSNLDTTYFRNRLRHEVMPLLERINPNIRAMLIRTAAVLAADYEVLQAQANAAWEQVTREASGARICLDLRGWRALPLALQRATIRRATWQLRPHLRDVSYQHVENAIHVAQRGETGAQATLPAGLMLRVDYDALTIMPVGGRLPPPDWPLLAPGSALSLSGPGEYPLPDSAWRFSLQEYDGPRSGPVWERLLADPWAVPLAAEALREPLALRTRRAGDRFRPSGVGGTQKVSTFMINEKIPALWRDCLPLLTAGEAIVWVCGWRVDERFVVRSETRRVWLARFERVS